ncbi:MAG: hypothetical protein ACO1OB_28395 [Archangium sp.]
MAEKPSWVRWVVLGLVVFGVMCLGSGIAVWKFGAKVSRLAISSPLPAGKDIVTERWTLTPASDRWRRMSDAAVKNLVKKDLWLVHADTGALLAVEGVESGEANQYLPSRLAQVMVEQQKRQSSAFELLGESSFETCGAPAQLREYRATREGIAMTYVAATYAGRGRGYDVTAWVEDRFASEMMEELRRAAKGLCPIDSDFDREWLKNFFILSEDEPFKSAFAEDTGSPQDRGQRALDFRVAGLARLSRRDLKRYAELMLALTRDTPPERCSDIWRWNAVVTEAQLETLALPEIRDWFRIERHAQQAVLDEKWADDATDAQAQDEVLENLAPEILVALGKFEPDASAETFCDSGRVLFTHALTLPEDERDALLRSLVSFD